MEGHSQLAGELSPIIFCHSTVFFSLSFVLGCMQKMVQWLQHALRSPLLDLNYSYFYKHQSCFIIQDTSKTNVI